MRMGRIPTATDATDGRCFQSVCNRWFISRVCSFATALQHNEAAGTKPFSQICWPVRLPDERAHTPSYAKRLTLRLTKRVRVHSAACYAPAGSRPSHYSSLVRALYDPLSIDCSFAPLIKSHSMNATSPSSIGKANTLFSTIFLY